MKRWLKNNYTDQTFNKTPLLCQVLLKIFFKSLKATNIYFDETVKLSVCWNFL